MRGPSSGSTEEHPGLAEAWRGLMALNASCNDGCVRLGVASRLSPTRKRDEPEERALDWLSMTLRKAGGEQQPSSETCPIDATALVASTSC
mmetsp:Transcript_19947/g.60536  ORF Transcript_19947/g.60536 Transcript_19947/m.60536 type:complete len:91 (-) Transcript_19947:1310-1582(-)